MKRYEPRPPTSGEAEPSIHNIIINRIHPLVQQAPTEDLLCARHCSTEEAHGDGQMPQCMTGMLHITVARTQGLFSSHLGGSRKAARTVGGVLKKEIRMQEGQPQHT